MDLNIFIENFAALFEETDAQLFNAQTRFKEIDEWSSLILLSVIAMIKVEYDVKIKGDEITSSQTVEDLYNIVKSRVQ
ncbi:MAG: acyl carrier protein [Bacteroidota bacterium]|nr:acyl carrier protein [Bacteroidota bacterium]